MLEQRPHHVRKKLAVLITVGVAVILAAVMVIKWSNADAVDSNETGSKLRSLYQEIVEDIESTPVEK